MPDDFVALEALLRTPAGHTRAQPPEQQQPARANLVEDAAPAERHEFAEFGSELAIARLAALEAYERAVPRLLEALARDVLARELTLAAPDVRALADALAVTYASEEPVAFAVAREDAARFPAGVPVRVDPRLRAGDVVLEVRDGEIDARFALRVRDAIAQAHGAR